MFEANMLHFNLKKKFKMIKLGFNSQFLKISNIIINKKT